MCFPHPGRRWWTPRDSRKDLFSFLIFPPFSCSKKNIPLVVKMKPFKRQRSYPLVLKEKTNPRNERPRSTRALCLVQGQTFTWWTRQLPLIWPNAESVCPVSGPSKCCQQPTRLLQTTPDNVTAVSWPAKTPSTCRAPCILLNQGWELVLTGDDSVQVFFILITEL